MTLVSLAKNPVPSGATVGLLPGQDGTLLRFARWRETTQGCRGTVVIVPGRSEFIEKYFETVADLRRRGFAVAIADLRGQGGSQRLLANPLKGHVRHFKDYDSDLMLFVREVVMAHLPPPYLALGHSLGGHILLRIGAAAQCPFERLIVTGPMIEIAPQQLGYPRGVVRTYVEMATLLGLSRTFPLGRSAKPNEAYPFEGNQLTSDRQRYERAQAIVAAAPELALGPPTIGWLRAALRSCSVLQAPTYPGRLRMPVLMFAAGQDEIVSTRAVEDFAPRIKLGSHVLIGAAKHEILQENDDIRGRFWASFDAYTDALTISATA